MRLKSMKLPVVAIMVAILFFVPVAHSLLLSKSYNPATKTVSISDIIFPVAEIQLTSNTEQCLIECEAVIRIKPSSNIQTPLFENSDFRWDFSKANPNTPGLQSYSFELLETIPYTVNNYKTTCSPYGTDYGNETITTEANCTQIIESSYTAYKIGRAHV